MKIVFMGTPDFAKESLESILDAGHEVVGVVAPPDRPKGRGMKMIACPVKEFAIEKNLKIFQPEKIVNNKEFKNEIKSLEPDLICVVSYGKILPKSFLEIPKQGCINVHPSLLPKYRGAAPIQWAILNGDKTTGVTIMYMNEKMDAGDIIIQEEFEIDENETTGELWNRLSTIGANLLVSAISQISDGTVKRIPQPEEYTIAPMIEKNMAKIDWENFNSRKIKNLVRGLNPILGAYSNLNGKKIKFWKIDTLEIKEFINKFTEYEEFEYRLKDMEPGFVIIADAKLGLYIRCVDGIISVLEIQGENAKKMNISDFLRGYNLEVGYKFE
ncbi:MAG: methionyl-tRNA formyltransferase [Clostridia bacterium]|nr:methionyl-tRNA formyltransferase [Clostridia bacterium]